MVILYDQFTEAFLFKIKEYDFLDMPEEDRINIIDGFMMRAFTEFNKILKRRQYNFPAVKDDTLRQFDFSDEEEFVLEQLEEDINEIVNIISDGMVLQWLKPFLNNQELLENALNTRDFTTYSPAELLKQVKGAYQHTRKEYNQFIREFSYNHMDLGELHS